MRILVLLFQALLWAQAPSTLTIRDRMEEGLRKQKDSVRKQAGAAGESESGSWFILPWPKPADMASPAPETAPAASEAPAAGAAPAPTPTPAKAVSFRPPAVTDCDPISSASIDASIDEIARREGLPGARLRDIIRKESAFKPCAVSPKGAMGLMQLMPDTARALGVSDPYDPLQNIDAGARYLKQMLDRYAGDWTKALAAYNAGPGAVDAAGGVPAYAETRDYVRELTKPAGTTGPF